MTHNKKRPSKKADFLTQSLSSGKLPFSKRLLRTFIRKTALILFRTFHHIANKQCVVVCCPPAPGINRGDDAMIVAGGEALKDAGYKNIILVATGPQRPTFFENDPQYKVVDNLNVLFASQGAWPEQLSWIKLLWGANQVVIFGADVLDESYGTPRSAGTFLAAFLSAKAGVPTRILGFSVSNVSETLRQRLSQLPVGVKLMIRDPVSLERLKHEAIAGLELVADTAFLLKPASLEELNPKIHTFISKYKGRLVAINISEVISPIETNKQKRLELLADAWCQIIDDADLYYLLIPHSEGDITWLRLLYNLIEQRRRGRTLLLEPLPSAKEIKRIVGHCEHVFTCKMHLAIAALGMGRPVTCFPYRGKFEGLMQLFGLSDNLIYSDEFPETALELASIFRRRIKANEKNTEQIQKYLPQVISLAKKNFEDLSL